MLGALTYLGNGWMSDSLSSPVGEIGLSVDGDAKGPSSDAIELARDLLANPRQAMDLGREFIASDPKAVAFMADSGDLLFDGFSVTATAGTFTANFGLAGWPDAMLNVRFSAWRPFEVWLGD